MKNLSFKYGEQAPLVVQDVSLDIPPGAAIALVGPSGSGKSTLLNLLAGLYKPTIGDIAYDNRPLHDMDLRGVRQQIGVVPQHPFIFGGTMRENISLGAPNTPLDRIAAAARVPARRRRGDADDLRHGHLRRRRLALGWSAPARRDCPRHPAQPDADAARRSDERSTTRPKPP